MANDPPKKKLYLTMTEVAEAFAKGAAEENAELERAPAIHKDDVAAGHYVRDVPTDD